MSKNLMSDSKSYYGENNIYEIFSKAEDYPGYILEYLKPLVTNKTLLDIGCGTGKYLKLLSNIASNIIGVDASKQQLEIAQQKIIDTNNIRLIHSDAESLSLENSSIDVIIGCWFLGTVKEESKRIHIIKNLKNYLKKGGKIILIENDPVSLFQTIKGKDKIKLNPDEIYNQRLISQGFINIQNIETYFKFENISQAKYIFQSIRGDKINSNIITNEIQHKINIFEFIKNI